MPVAFSRFFKHDLPLVKPVWLSQITSLFSIYLGIIFWRIRSAIMPSTEVRLTSLYFLRSSLLTYLKIDVIFLLFLAVGNSSDCHNFSYLSTILWHSNFKRQFPQDKVEWTYASSGCLDCLKPDLIIQWAALHSPVPTFAFLTQYLKHLTVKTKANM